MILSRRRFLASSAGMLAMPGLSRAASRPIVSHGVQSGDVDRTSGIVWARSDRPARLHIEIATTESFADARKLKPVTALPGTDLAAKRLVSGLPPDQTIFYRLRFADLSDVNGVSEPVIGRFRTAPVN